MIIMFLFIPGKNYKSPTKGAQFCILINVSTSATNSSISFGSNMIF